MTRKDYIATAAILAPYMSEGERSRKVATGIALSLAAEFAGDSSRFDSKRFLAACAVDLGGDT